MATQRTELILTTSGGEKVKATLESLGTAGDAAFKKIGKGATDSAAHLKVLDAAVGEIKGNVQAMGGTLGSVLGAAGGTLGGVAVGATAAAAGFAALYKRAAEYAGGLKDATERTGFAAGKLQEISFAFRQAGVDNEGLNSALAKFSKNVGDARRGTGDLYSILKDNDRALLQQLVSVGSNEKAFGLFADKIAATKNAQDQATLSVAGFGKVGTALLQVLRGGSAELERSAAAARKFGLVMDESLITKGDDASDAMDLLADSIKSNLYQAVLQVGPELQTMAKTIAEIVTRAREGHGVVGQFLNSFTERGRTMNEIGDLEAGARRMANANVGPLGRLLGLDQVNASSAQSMRERADELRRLLYEDQQQANTAASAGSPGDGAKALDLKIKQAAADAGIDETIFRALIKRESGFKQSAVSGKGATGLAQLMPGTAAALGVDPNDPNQNLTGGAKYLRQQLDAFGGNYALALAAYNAGPGRVRSAQRAAIAAGGDPMDVSNLQLPKETQDYVAAILNGKDSGKLGLGKAWEHQLDAYKRALTELTQLEADAYKSGLAGVDKLMAERDVAYTAWNKLADEAQLSEAERAKGNLAIWTRSERQITAVREDEADKRRKAIQDEANYVDEQTRRATEEQAKLYAKPFENFLEGVQQGFADLGTKILEDGKITSQEWTDLWKNAGVRLLSELVSLEFNQAIAIPLMQALSGQGGGSTSSASSIALTALSRGAGGGSSLTDIVTGLFSGGTTAGAAGTGNLGLLASAFSGGEGTAALLTLGLGAAQSGGRFKLTPTSGGLLGLSALRAVAPYLAGTSYGSSLLSSLGNGSYAQLAKGVLGLTTDAGTTTISALEGGFSSSAYGYGASLVDGSTAISQQALTDSTASLASSVSSVVSIVGSLYSLYSSVDGTIKTNQAFGRATYGDTRAGQNFAGASYAGLGAAAGVGALAGFAIGSSGGPIGMIVGALAGAAIGAASATIVNQEVARQVGAGTASAASRGLTQGQLNKRIADGIANGTVGKLLPHMYVNQALFGGGDQALFASAFAPDIEDIYDKILTARMNSRGATFNRHLTVLGQGTTAAGRAALDGRMGEIRSWAYFLNQLTGAGVGDGSGERTDRSAAIIYNTIASRARNPEQADRALYRGIRGFFGGELSNALYETGSYFLRPRGGYRGDLTEGDYRNRVSGILTAFEPALPKGTDVEGLVSASFARYGRARADRMLRLAREQSFERNIAGDDGAAFDGFSYRFPGKYTARQRRGVAASEAALAESSAAYQRGAFAAQFGAAAGFRTVDEGISATFGAIGALKPGQFGKRLPDLIGQLTDQTAQWGQELSGLIDTMRQLDESSRQARLSLGDTVDALLVAAGQGGTNTADRYAAEIARVSANLPLAKSGGAQVGIYTSLANLETGKLSARIADIQEQAAAAGIPQLASLAGSATDQRIGIEEAGMGPRGVRKARRARLDAALAKYRAASGADKAAAAQEVLAANAAYLGADGSSAGRRYGLGIATEISGATDAASASQRAIEQQIRDEQAATATRLKEIQPKLQQAYDQQAGEVRAGLLKAGLTSAQIDAAVADPVVASQIVQTAQLEKLTKLLDAIEDIRDFGTGQKQAQQDAGRRQARGFILDQTGGPLGGQRTA